MSEPAPSTAPPSASAAAWDTLELRRSIAVSFSASELKQLAEALGVGSSISWERGSAEAVRDLVRQFERYYGLEILLAKLRELRPLVDWPEAAAPPDPPPAAAAPEPGAKTVAAAPLALDEGEAGPVIRDPLAPASVAPPPASRAAPVWPGTTTPAAATPAAPRGLDPRLLVVVAGLTVLAALIAYAAGRSASAPAPATADSAAPLASGVAVRPGPRGPAARAALTLDRSLGDVIAACELPAGTDHDAMALARALEQCGPAAPGSRVRIPVRDPLDAAAATPDRPASTPARPRPTRTAAGSPAAKDPAPAQAASDACVGGCEAARKGCNAGCGTEPLESSKYEAYQQCRTRCLSSASHCRLTCPP